MDAIRILALALADVTVFGGVWVIGLGAGAITPGTRLREWAAHTGVIGGTAALAAFLAAVLGTGAIAWAIWFIWVGLVGVFYVLGVRRRSLTRRFDRQVGK